MLDIIEKLSMDLASSLASRHYKLWFNDWIERMLLARLYDTKWYQTKISSWTSTEHTRPGQGRRTLKLMSIQNSNSQASFF
jgi:hypothetical protein